MHLSSQTNAVWCSKFICQLFYRILCNIQHFLWILNFSGWNIAFQKSVMSNGSCTNGLSTVTINHNYTDGRGSYINS